MSLPKICNCQTLPTPSCPFHGRDGIPAELMPLMIHIYNVGYHAGHNDTVEAGYVDVHTSDMDSYHADEVAELANDLWHNATAQTPPDSGTKNHE